MESIRITGDQDRCPQCGRSETQKDVCPACHGTDALDRYRDENTALRREVKRQQEQLKKLESRNDALLKKILSFLRELSGQTKK